MQNESDFAWSPHTVAQIHKLFGCKVDPARPQMVARARDSIEQCFCTHMTIVKTALLRTPVATSIHFVDPYLLPLSSQLAWSCVLEDIFQTKSCNKQVLERFWRTLKSSYNRRYAMRVGMNDRITKLITRLTVGRHWSLNFLHLASSVSTDCSIEPLRGRLTFQANWYVFWTYFFAQWSHQVFFFLVWHAVHRPCTFLFTTHQSQGLIVLTYFLLGSGKTLQRHTISRGVCPFLISKRGHKIPPPPTECAGWKLDNRSLKLLWDHQGRGSAERRWMDNTTPEHSEIASVHALHVLSMRMILEDISK